MHEQGFFYANGWATVHKTVDKSVDRLKITRK